MSRHRAPQRQPQHPWHLPCCAAEWRTAAQPAPRASSGLLCADLRGVSLLACQAPLQQLSRPRRYQRLGAPARARLPLVPPAWPHRAGDRGL